jgi:hypothetical protein
MYNLIHHKQDFGIDASWVFSASGHGKGPCDGIGATVKSTATRSCLRSGRVFASARDFYDFTKESNNEAARLNQTTEVPVNVFFLDRSVVEHGIPIFLTDRWSMLKGESQCTRSIVSSDFSS